MRWTIAHSPDSDDAYMMAPLALGWIDPEGFEFQFVRQDIETLNKLARLGTYEVTAISFAIYPEIQDIYDLLPSGSSIQEGTGPLVVGRKKLNPDELRSIPIAIPGPGTSAFLCLRHWLGNFRWEARPFDQILDEVALGRFEAGLLIHESQLLYALKDLVLIQDLGQWWKQTHDLPLPMGGNALRSDLPLSLRLRFAQLMRRSVETARLHHEASLDYAASFGRGMDRTTLDRYVRAWVNDFTLEPGPRGRQAVEKLLGQAVQWVGNERD